MGDFLFLAIILVIVLGGIGISIFYIRRETRGIKEEKKDEFALNLIKQDIDSMKKRFEDGYNQMALELGRVQEIGHDLKSLQEFLQSPKLRGNLGEQVLRNLLEQILPKNSFQVQYRFREGDIVDAVIKTNQGIIPVDSKFPMENFKKASELKGKDKESCLKIFIRDIKKHINDISKKYILPQEGTVDFAIMYVPFEAVYYEIITNQPEILDYGYSKKIYLVSSNSFYYFLKIIMLALQGARIEEASKKILAGLKAIQQESVKFGDELNTLTSHIDHAKSSSERAQNRYGRLIGKIDYLGELEMPEEKKKIE